MHTHNKTHHTQQLYRQWSVVLKATKQDFMGYLPCFDCDKNFPQDEDRTTIKVYPVVAIESARVDGDLQQDHNDVANSIYCAIVKHWSTQKVL